MAEKTIEYKILIDDAQSAKTLADLEESAEQLNQELKNLDPRSQDFKNLASAAQEVNSEIEQINNQIEGLSFEDKIAAFDGGMKILAGSTQSVVGAFGLLGIESEKLAFLEEQAANAIAFGLGLKDLSEGLGQVAIAFNKSGIAAQLFGKVTKRALIATGIGALVVALGTVIAYWDEINELVSGTNKSIEEQNNLLEENIESGNIQISLLRQQYENSQLRGESGIQYTEEIQKQLLLQQEQNNLLLEALELELARTKEENASVSTWEKIKIGFAGALGVGLQTKAITAAIAEDSEETEELQNKINDAKSRGLELEKQLLLIGQQRNEDAEREAFLNREKVEALEVTTVGLTELDVEKLQSDADFEDLINREKIKSNEAYAQAVIANQAKLDAARSASLDNLIAIAGAETNVGRALLIAKQVLAARELILEAKKTISFASSKAAEATVATAAGAAKTAAIGFPQNIPLLIAYAVQAAGIIAAVVSAVKGAKGAAKAAGGSITTPQVPRIPTGGARGAQAPTTPTPGVGQIDVAEAAFQQQGAIKAYVVEGDVRTSQEAAAKIQSRRTLAG